jgi:uncharacterized protein YjbI with pentapeptide repeats
METTKIVILGEGNETLFEHECAGNTAKLTLEEAVRQNICLHFAQLDGLDLAGANLKGADMVAAILDNTNLKGANLEGATIAGGEMREANLEGANMAGAKLSGANLTGANLTHANLTSADLTYAILDSADLQHADMTDADVSCAYFECAKLQWSEMRNAIAKHANFTKAALSGADLRGADFEMANLTGAVINKALAAKDTFGNTLHALYPRTYTDLDWSCAVVDADTDAAEKYVKPRVQREWDAFRESMDADTSTHTPPSSVLARSAAKYHYMEDIYTAVMHEPDDESQSPEYLSPTLWAFLKEKLSEGGNLMEELYDTWECAPTRLTPYHFVASANEDEVARLFASWESATQDNKGGSMENEERGNRMKRKEIMERIVREHKAYCQKLQEEDMQGRDALAILERHAIEFADKEGFAFMAKMDSNKDEDTPPANYNYNEAVVNHLSVMAGRLEADLLDYVFARYMDEGCTRYKFVSDPECFFDSEEFYSEEF